MQLLSGKHSEVTFSLRLSSSQDFVMAMAAMQILVFLPQSGQLEPFSHCPSMW